MGIDATWIDEQHRPKQQVLDPCQCLTSLATSEWLESQTVCLRFIDAWGDTIFNQSQIPILLKELRDSEMRQNDNEIKMHLGKVIDLVCKAVDETHTYIMFVGD